MYGKIISNNIFYYWKKFNIQVMEVLTQQKVSDPGGGGGSKQYFGGHNLLPLAGIRLTEIPH